MRTRLVAFPGMSRAAPCVRATGAVHPGTRPVRERDLRCAPEDQARAEWDRRCASEDQARAEWDRPGARETSSVGERDRPTRSSPRSRGAWGEGRRAKDEGREARGEGREARVIASTGVLPAHDPPRRGMCWLSASGCNGPVPDAGLCRSAPETCARGLRRSAPETRSGGGAALRRRAPEACAGAPEACSGGVLQRRAPQCGITKVMSNCREV